MSHRCRETTPPTSSSGSPDQLASVGLALLVVLDALGPAERLSFVLHDMFDVPFDEIASILGRSPTAARQLASRARRRVHATTPALDADLTRHREVVNAFLAVSRGGRFDTLVALLDPDVVLRADQAAVDLGATAEVVGAHGVAKTFAGRARAARLALVNGATGAVWVHAGQRQVVFAFTITGGRVSAIDILADPAARPAGHSHPRKMTGTLGTSLLWRHVRTCQATAKPVTKAEDGLPDTSVVGCSE